MTDELTLQPRRRYSPRDTLQVVLREECHPEPALRAQLQREPRDALSRAIGDICPHGLARQQGARLAGEVTELMAQLERCARPQTQQRG